MGKTLLSSVAALLLLPSLALAAGPAESAPKKKPAATKSSCAKGDDFCTTMFKVLGYQPTKFKEIAKGEDRSQSRPLTCCKMPDFKDDECSILPNGDAGQSYFCVTIATEDASKDWYQRRCEKEFRSIVPSGWWVKPIDDEEAPTLFSGPPGSDQEQLKCGVAKDKDDKTGEIYWGYFFAVEAP